MVYKHLKSKGVLNKTENKEYASFVLRMKTLGKSLIPE